MRVQDAALPWELPDLEDRAQRVQSSGPVVPDLDRYSRVTNDTVRVVVGTNPQDVLDLYLSAQQRAGEIREEIAKVEALYASYKARFWAGGQSTSFYDNDRKALLSKLKHNIRAAATRKMTNDEVDEDAHIDPEYIRFIEREKQKRQEMEDLAAKLSRLNGQLETALGVVSYYDKAHRSTDALVWFAREENKKTF